MKNENARINEIFGVTPDSFKFSNVRDKEYSFSSLISAARSIEAASFDVKEKLSEVELGTAIPLNSIFSELRIRPKYALWHSDFEEDWMQFSKWGFGQLCSLLGVPATFMEKYLAEGTTESIKEAMDILTYWKRKVDDQDVLLRFTGDRLCGALSSRYKVYDDSEFLTLIQNTLMKKMDLKVVNQIASPDITKVRLISPDDVKIGGENLHLAFDISNSRVGRSSVKIQFLLYRWICSNGMIFGGGRSSIFCRSHRTSIDAAEITNLLDSVPDLVKMVKGWVENGVDNELNQQALDKLTAQFRLQFNSESAANNVISLMDQKYDRTLWGYTNAITEMAQDYDVFTRERMEAFAGQTLRRAA